MKDIKELDQDFALETNIKRDGLLFYDIEQPPFKIHGIFKADGRYRRMPKAIARTVSEGVCELSEHTAGGRVRFITNSPYVVLQAKGSWGKMCHFALTGSAGFDMYAEYDEQTRYVDTFCPPFGVTDAYESVVDFSDRKERVITVNFPLYSCVTELYLGLQEGCVLKEAPAYHIAKPIVFYGSSITQGGCASKPGSSYQSILSREFNFDYINLGFAGNAKGEDEIVDYITGLDMSAFVMDYDHNAPSPQHLEATHEKMFLAIRAAHPSIPIIIMPRPKYYLNDVDEACRKIVEQTYLNAKARGDEYVYYISGQKLMDMVKDNGTVDNCHPTDSGFFSMACAVSEILREIL